MTVTKRRSKRLWLLLAAVVLAAVPARATTITYTENTVGGNGGNVTTCNAAATLSAALTMVQSGATAGSNSPSILKGASAAVTFDTSPGPDPNLTSWAAGNWTVKINVTTANTHITWTDTCIYRVSTGTTILGTVGTLTGQTLSLGTTGVQSMTISGASQSAASTDLIEVIVVFHNAANNTQSFTLDLGNATNDTVATPLSSGAAAPCQSRMLMGMGC